ncbi:hypothetical protein SAMN05518672_102110 [Chitinophaga sp. CF118]|uniref:hypothetical protein n=1 Tax=Chitinophaga sp. CF118 TaxID=1884367 RepID=UPI0008F3AF64|nr:hypothetical protein [Chitinophaga sp. CF118]SFD47851.1 hypothetical protein SAMN05518672_102110 [Chitinophaga sp. CF118]
MAKWVREEPPPFTGTKDGVTVYQLPDGLYYARMQSSITGKRIKKDKAFANFRRSSGRLSEGSRIASQLYRQLPVKNHKVYREMTGKAILGLKEGLSAEVITANLSREYLPVIKKVSKTVVPVVRKSTPRLFKTLPFKTFIRKQNQIKLPDNTAPAKEVMILRE